MTVEDSGTFPRGSGLFKKKKVALASVMVMDPQVLLLGEPTAGLDPRSSQTLVDLIREAQAQGKTVITATNDLHIVAEIASRILVLGEDRRILISGTPEEILADREILLSANLVHHHRHAHGALWHEHEHAHPVMSPAPGPYDQSGGHVEH